MLELVPAQCQITTARAPRRLQKPQNLVPVCPCARVPLTAISGDSVPAHASSAAQDGPLVEWSRDLNEIWTFGWKTHFTTYLTSALAARGTEGIPTIYARNHDDQTLVPAKRRRDKTLKVSVTGSTGQHGGVKIKQAEKETWNAAARQATNAMVQPASRLSIAPTKAEKPAARTWQSTSPRDSRQVRTVFTCMRMAVTPPR
ncbi:hypothetical protein MGG_15147 [Pyricularia oryzae 70-15]|uniref:Uncharacterized protein n=1 Tax=Pyricularia oryzae (strain 70-15 / ATCC MYA-4617 / FGSC 8958) TaxID=242507 RepID=G4MLE3_PYRO7|nr:uncharacterized protein MGG_15147 [Pyricularia oryzae 70-15]EHA57673.1 hypothetical protein MGG_15147 [Pyricularia oryzae 70-15]